MIENNPQNYSSLKYYSYGTCLFTSTSFLATPFLLLKRRIQMGTETSVYGLLKSDGIRGSFRGGSLSWISGVNRMVYFTIYEKAVNIFGNTNIHYKAPGTDTSGHAKQSLTNAAAAALASIASQAVLTPVSVVTTHMHVHSCPHMSATQVLNYIVSKNRSYGVLWTGYSSALVQAIPTNMTLFAVYTFTRNHAKDWGLMETPLGDLFVRLSCSLLGTYTAVLVTSPVDIVRTHRQALVSENMSVTSLNSGSAAIHGHSPPVPSSFRMMQEIYRKFGWRHLYSGQSARLMSSAPFTVAMLIGYDYVKLFSLALTEEGVDPC